MWQKYTHWTKKLRFSLRASLVNVTKSAGNYLHLYLHLLKIWRKSFIFWAVTIIQTDFSTNVFLKVLTFSGQLSTVTWAQLATGEFTKLFHIVIYCYSYCFHCLQFQWNQKHVPGSISTIWLTIDSPVTWFMFT